MVKTKFENTKNNFQTCSKRSGDFQVVYFTESDENILEIPKADPVFSFKRACSSIFNHKL